MKTPNLTVTIAPSASSVGCETWNGLAPGSDGVPDNPFLDYAFFDALERSGCATGKTGWQPQHLVIKREDDVVGLMPLFVKSHSQGEYVFDYGWADAFQRAGGKYYPKLQCSIPFTPVTAPKLWVKPGDEGLRPALLDAAAQIAGQNNISSVHATFVPEDEEALAQEMGWLTRHDVQFHWRNQGFTTFEGFLDTLASRKRKTIRRERREALQDGLSVKWLTGADLDEAAWDAFFAFYMDTGGRKWGRPYLNRRFFSMLSEAMADRVVLMLAYDGPKPIAGALNLLGKDTLYGRNWGATRDVPFLHFELCYYQAIDFAIAHGLKTVEAGAQGEHKLARGYEPVITRSIHWISHAGLRDAVASYLVQERHSVDRSQAELERYTPFRRGERSDGRD